MKEAMASNFEGRDAIDHGRGEGWNVRGRVQRVITVLYTAG